MSATKTPTETRINIVNGVLASVTAILAIVTSLAAFGNSLKAALSWFQSQIGWGLALRALIFVFLLAALVYTFRKTFQKLWRRIKPSITLRRVTFILAFLAAFNAGLIAERYTSRPETREIQGSIYYIPSQNKPGLEPVADVTVSHAHLKSDPTDASGKFVIKGIPVTHDVRKIIAAKGGMDYPTDYDPGGTYAVIPRHLDDEPKFYREITDPWVEQDGNHCPTESTTQVATKKRFVLNTFLPGNKEVETQETFVAVVVRSPANFTMMNAFVMDPPAQSGLYRNAMVGLEKESAHRWVFYLPKEGQRVKLEVCLGSNDSSGTPWQQQLYTYELR
jgi:hypothetical protein